MEDLQKEFIPYDRALKMKALGFDEPCFGYYDGNHNFSYMFKGKPEDFSDKKFPLGHSVGWTSAPTFSQAFRWFRENYKMNPMIQITTSNGTRENWFWEIYDSRGWKVKDGQELSDPYNISYEEAELTCLDKLLEIVESKKKD